MSVNVKQNGNLTTVANNISITQANWNDRNNIDKNSCIKNQPATLNTLEEISANTDTNALAGANAVKELNDILVNLTQVTTINDGTVREVYYGDIPQTALLHVVVIYGVNRTTQSYRLGYDISSVGSDYYLMMPSAYIKQGQDFTAVLKINHNTKKLSLNQLMVNGVNSNADSNAKLYVGWSYA